MGEWTKRSVLVSPSIVLREEGGGIQQGNLVEAKEIMSCVPPGEKFSYRKRGSLAEVKNVAQSLPACLLSVVWRGTRSACVVVFPFLL